MHRHGPRQVSLSAARSLLSVAPPVDSLDVVRMIVPPRSAHAAGTDVVRHDVAVLGKPFLAECADAILCRNLSVHQLPHLGIRTKFPVAARMMGIFDAADTQLSAASFLCRRFPAAAELRAVNWAHLITAKSHGFLLIGLRGELMLICADQCRSAEEGQSDGVFMRALPQGVPVMCGTEVAHPDASRQH